MSFVEMNIYLLDGDKDEVIHFIDPGDGVDGLDDDDDVG